MLHPPRVLLPLFLLFATILPASSQFVFYGENRKFGYKDEYGTVVIQPQFDLGTDFSEGVARVCKDDKWGYIDTQGEWVNQIRYSWCGDFKEGLAQVEIDSLRGYIDRNFNIVIQPKYKDAEDFSEGKAAVKVNKKWGYINKKGEYVLLPQYSHAHGFSEGLALVMKNGKAGYIDDKGDVVIPFQFQHSGNFENGVAWVKKDNKYGWIDNSGKYVVQPQYEEMTMFEEGLSVAKKDGKTGYIDQNGNWYDTREEGLRALAARPDEKADDMVEKARSEVEQRQVETVLEVVQNTQQNAAIAPMVTENPEPEAAESVAETRARATEVTPQKTVAARQVASAASGENTFVVIVANGKYMNASEVAFAANDGRAVAESLTKFLGVPERNIISLNDATGVQMKNAVRRLGDIAETYRRVRPDTKFNVIYYYVGHGLPDDKAKMPYLLPVDVDPRYPEDGISLGALYTDLADLGAAQVTVLLDACFSGTGRSDTEMLNNTSLAARLAPRPAEPEGNVVVISATEKDQTAYPYAEKGHDLFTWYLIEKLRASDGRLTLGDLAGYVSEQVSLTSVLIGKKQYPSVSISRALGGDWRSFPLVR